MCWRKLLLQPLASLIDLLFREDPGRKGNLSGNLLSFQYLESRLDGLMASGGIFKCGGKYPLPYVHLSLLRQPIDTHKCDHLLAPSSFSCKIRTMVSGSVVCINNINVLKPS